MRGHMAVTYRGPVHFYTNNEVLSHGLDLSPLDFYLWMQLESVVYAEPVPDVQTLISVMLFSYRQEHSNDMPYGLNTRQQPGKYVVEEWPRVGLLLTLYWKWCSSHSRRPRTGRCRSPSTSSPRCSLCAAGGRGGAGDLRRPTSRPSPAAHLHHTRAAHRQTATGTATTSLPPSLLLSQPASPHPPARLPICSPNNTCTPLIAPLIYTSPSTDRPLASPRRGTLENWPAKVALVNELRTLDNASIDVKSSAFIYPVCKNSVTWRSGRGAQITCAHYLHQRTFFVSQERWPHEAEQPAALHNVVELTRANTLGSRGHPESNALPTILEAESPPSRFPLIYHNSSRPLGAPVAERLARSPPTKVNRAQSPAGSPDLPSVNRAGRWSEGFLGDFPFPLPLHSCAAPYPI
ncbi:hypothetical protein PR048_019855 [Dryococelus australis]|uniref:Uncharacterized protein n=1 Tax=Dryococelus australis TaxID=614101 RepID=A0ABQ9H4Q8_9NEOP|nr:hypothetical protein PR048_019855 [Dryococelus australis]